MKIIMIHARVYLATSPIFIGIVATAVRANVMWLRLASIRDEWSQPFKNRERFLNSQSRENNNYNMKRLARNLS